MKKTIIFVLLFILNLVVYSQTIYEILQSDSLNYFQKIASIEQIKLDASKGLRTIDSSALKRYVRYATFWDSRIDQNGDVVSYVNAMKNYSNTKQNSFPVNWDNFGPRNVYSGSAPYLGRINSVEGVIKGDDTIIYVGAANGGL